MPGLSFAHWENHPVWQSSGTSENHPIWQSAGAWENHPNWESSGGWENHPNWENSGAWENHPNWESSGNWENHPNWESSGDWENHPNWEGSGAWENHAVWQNEGSWQNNPYRESSGEWQPGGGHWEVEEGWFWDDYWGWAWRENWTWVSEPQWVDTSHWVDNWEWVDGGHWEDNWEWVDTSHWVDNWEWTDTSHWVDNWEWTDTSHWADNWEWTDTSHWVDNWVYVNTSHWVDNWVYVDTSQWVDNWVWVDTSHWVDHLVWVDDPVNQPPATSLNGPTTLAPGASGYFSASASDANGNLTRWRMYLSSNPNPQWTSIGGGSVSTGLNYSFSSPGTYTWMVDAEDSGGASSSSSLTVTVGDPNQAPTASITGPTSLTVGQQGSFGASASDSDSNLYRWRLHFSDNPNPQWTYVSGGSVSTSINWTFNAPGTYTWVLDVENTSGASYSTSRAVTVNAVAAPLAAPTVALYPVSQLFGNSLKTYVKAGETQAFNIAAQCPDGLNEVGLESCDVSGVPLANLGISSVSGTEAYRRLIWTAPATLGLCYFRGYAWNADRSQLTRSAVVAITIKAFDIESYALAEMNGYTTVPGDGITFSCTISAPNQYGVVTLIIYEHGDWGVGLLRQESIDVNTGEVTSRYDGVSQVDPNANPYEAWLPGGADDPYANWDPDEAFAALTQQEQQDELLANLPPGLQAQIATSQAAHHAVQLNFSDGSTLLLLPDGVPTGGTIVNNKYVFTDPRAPTQTKYISLEPPVQGEGEIVMLPPFIVNGGPAPDNFDWLGLYNRYLGRPLLLVGDRLYATPSPVAPTYAPRQEPFRNPDGSKDEAKANQFYYDRLKHTLSFIQRARAAGVDLKKPFEKGTKDEIIRAATAAALNLSSRTGFAWEWGVKIWQDKANPNDYYYASPTTDQDIGSVDWENSSSNWPSGLAGRPTDAAGNSNLKKIGYVHTHPDIKYTGASSIIEMQFSTPLTSVNHKGDTVPVENGDVAFAGWASVTPTNQPYWSLYQKTVGATTPAPFNVQLDYPEVPGDPSTSLIPPP